METVTGQKIVGKKRVPGQVNKPTRGKKMDVIVAQDKSDDAWCRGMARLREIVGK